MASVAERELRVVNPATLELVATVPVAPPEAVAEAVAEARLAGAAWRESPPGARKALLLAVARVLLERMDEIAETVRA